MVVNYQLSDVQHMPENLRNLCKYCGFRSVEIANRAIQEYVDAAKYGLNRTIEVEV